MADPTREAHLQRLLDTTLHTAVGVVGADAATISVKRGDSPSTLAASDQRMVLLDETQYQANSGPCVDILSGRASHNAVQDLDEETRWPAFRDAGKDAAIRSVLSLPIELEGESGVTASLNLYAHRPNAFHAEQAKAAISFAGQLGATIASTDAYRATALLADQLAEAMKSRATIEQAKGMLMRDHAIDADRAFDLLRHASQTTNTKLATVAQRIVSENADRSKPAPQPFRGPGA